MDKYIGEIFIQRTRKQFRMGCHTPDNATAKKAIFWKIVEVSNDTGNLVRCQVENDKGDKHRGRFGTRNNMKGMQLIIINHYDNKYECYGSSGIAYNKDCFNFPLKNYHKAFDWMQDFHRELGHPVPDESHDVPSEDSVESYDVPTEDNMVDYDTPKRKRSDSVETHPPTPKKVKVVGRFTVTNANPETMTDKEINEKIQELQDELKRRVIETNAV